MLATCRHSLLLKGLDMLQGEMFAYPYILQVCTNYFSVETADRLGGVFEKYLNFFYNNVLG
jgi:hypothetical protein